MRPSSSLASAPSSCASRIRLAVDRFRELEADGKIGSLADVHYSFMGAGLNPDAYEDSAAQVARLTWFAMPSLNIWI